MSTHVKIKVTTNVTLVVDDSVEHATQCKKDFEGNYDMYISYLATYTTATNSVSTVQAIIQPFTYKAWRNL